VAGSVALEGLVNSVYSWRHWSSLKTLRSGSEATAFVSSVLMLFSVFEFGSLNTGFVYDINGTGEDVSL
jgi:hypothetical protein